MGKSVGRHSVVSVWSRAATVVSGGLLVTLVRAHPLQGTADVCIHHLLVVTIADAYHILVVPGGVPRRLLVARIKVWPSLTSFEPVVEFPLPRIQPHPASILKVYLAEAWSNSG